MVNLTLCILYHNKKMFRKKKLKEVQEHNCRDGDGEGLNCLYRMSRSAKKYEQLTNPWLAQGTISQLGRQRKQQGKVLFKEELLGDREMKQKSGHIPLGAQSGIGRDAGVLTRLLQHPFPCPAQPHCPCPRAHPPARLSIHPFHCPLSSLSEGENILHKG